MVEKLRGPGKLPLAVGTAEDIIEAPHQEALRRAAFFQSAIFNSINFSSITTDAQGVIQLFNVGAERMLGYLAAEVVNKVTPADLSDLQEIIARAKALSVELGTPIAPGFEALVSKASSGMEDIYELSYIRKDGSRVPTVVSVTAQRDAQNTLLGYLLVSTDDSERKLAQQALRKAESLQSAIFNSAHFSSIATDEKGVIQIFNVGAERMLGYTAAEVINKITPADISDPQEIIARAKALSDELGTPIAPGFEALVFKASRGIEDIYELTYLRKDGSRFPAIVSVTALRDAQDTIIGYLLIGTDNTQRKRSESALRESEDRYHHLFNSIDEGFCVVEMIFDEHEKPVDYRFLEVNPPFEKLTGLHEATGKRIREFAPDLDTSWFETYGKVVLTGEAVRFVNEAKELNRWFDVYAFRIGGPESRKVAILFSNITENKRAEEALRASEERFRALVTTSSEVVYRMSPDWGEMRQLNGRDFVADTETPNSNWLQAYIFPDDQPQVLAVINEAIRTKGVFDLEHRVRRVDGSLGWASSRAVPLLDASGEIVEWFGAASDVTERKKTTEALRQSEARFRALFDRGPVAMYSCDSTGTIQEYNQGAVDLWGQEPKSGDTDERFGSALKLFNPDGTFIPYVQTPMAQVLKGKTPEAADVEVIVERPDGSRIITLANIVPLLNGQGEITGAINCFYDITERKQFELNLNNAVAAADKANLAKSDFLSSMSHELRTPLNAVLGFAQLIQSGSPPPTPTQQRHLDQILKGGWFLLELINEILDLTVIELGRLNLSLVSVSLSEVILECQAMFEPQAQTRGIQMTFPQMENPCLVNADRKRVKQVLVNLLSNAIKYNQVGGSVVVECVEHAQGHVRLSITDSGAGLSPEKLAQLFQPFNRLGQETSMEEGTGIGLVVTKRLVELMGGAIGAESTVGVGSVFWVELRLA